MIVYLDASALIRHDTLREPVALAAYNRKLRQGARASGANVNALSSERLIMARFLVEQQRVIEGGWLAPDCGADGLTVRAPRSLSPRVRSSR